MASTRDSKMRMITLEEHYATQSFIDGPGRHLRGTTPAGQVNSQAGEGSTRLLDQLCNFGERRIAEMDTAGIDMQVLSLTSPGVEQLEASEAVKVARESNDILAAAVKRHPTRLAGFATLPTPAPIEAAEELKRTIREYGFKGAAINGHIRGRYLDDKFFWPILKCAEDLNVPIYLHPTRPPKPVVDSYYVGNFSPEVSSSLASSAWGWHIETAIHVLRIILGGVFDEYPRLQFVIGHLGEALPFMLPRLEQRLPMDMTRLQRTIGDYLRENIHYTVSGFNYVPAFLDLLLEVGVDRIMFSADYPYGSMVKARDFLEDLPLSIADKHRIAHGNSERLLGL